MHDQSGSRFTIVHRRSFEGTAMDLPEAVRRVRRYLGPKGMTMSDVREDVARVAPERHRGRS